MSRCLCIHPEQRPGKWLHYRAIYCSDCGRFIKWMAWPHSVDAQREFMDRALAVAKENRYQRGWAAHKYKELFGEWPDNR